MKTEYWEYIKSLIGFPELLKYAIRVQSDVGISNFNDWDKIKDVDAIIDQIYINYFFEYNDILLWELRYNVDLNLVKNFNSYFKSILDFLYSATDPNITSTYITKFKKGLNLNDESKTFIYNDQEIILEVVNGVIDGVVVFYEELIDSVKG